MRSFTCASVRECLSCGTASSRWSYDMCDSAIHILTVTPQPSHPSRFQSYRGETAHHEAQIIPLVTQSLGSVHRALMFFNTFTALLHCNFLEFGSLLRLGFCSLQRVGDGRHLLCTCILCFHFLRFAVAKKSQTLVECFERWVC